MLRKILGLTLAAMMILGCGKKNDHDEENPIVTPEPTAQHSDEVKKDTALTSDFAAENETIGELRGYAEINQLIKQRVMAQTAQFDVSRYLGDANSFGGGLIDLLGVSVGVGVDAGFRNGIPNAVNMVLYRMIADGVGDRLAQACAASDHNQEEWTGLSAGVQENLNVLCGWPSSSAMSETTLNQFWMALMSFDAPPSERDLWRDFFVSSYVGQTAAETIKAMSVAILINPYFLLKQ